jgi:putative ABC transport system permease protein
MSRLPALLRQAFRNLLRNPRRSLVTGAAILSGFVGLTLLSGYIAWVERYLMVTTVYLNHSGHIQIFKKDGLDRFFSKPKKYLISPEEEKIIRDILGAFKNDIEFIAPYVIANGLLQYEKVAFPFQGKGVTPEAEKFTKNHFLVKEWTEELSYNQTGQSLSEVDPAINPVKITYNLFESIGKNKTLNLQGITIDNGFNALDAEVISLYSTGLELTEDTSLQTTLNVFRDLMATEGSSFLGLYLKKDFNTRWIVAELNAAFKKKSLPFEAHPFYDERIGLFYRGSMNFLYAMGAFFFILVSLVVVLSIANTISMNIMERIRELGTMRAIGFTPKTLSRLMAWESFFLALLSIAIGYVVSQLIAFAINLANIRFFPPGIAGDMQFVLTPWTSVCFLIAIPLIGLAVLTAFFVTARKVKGEVAKLLSETTT